MKSSKCVVSGALPWSSSIKAATLIAILGTTGSVSAQDWPSKVIRIITSASGGTADTSSRLIGNALSKRVGQPVVIDNHAGAVNSMEAAIKASPDGYTLYLYGNGVWLAPFIFPDLRYDPLKELAPISLTTVVPFVLVVHPSLPAKTVGELITLAKSQPGVLNYGAGPISGTPNTAAQLFKVMAGVNIVQVPYKSSGPALTDVIAGRIQMMISTTAAMVHVRAGNLRALGVTTTARVSLAPDVPPISETLPGYEVTSTQAVFVPVKTPEVILRRLNQEIVAILRDPEVKKRFFDIGAETAPTTPEVAIAKAQSERQRLGKIVRELGVGEGS